MANSANATEDDPLLGRRSWSQTRGVLSNLQPSLRERITAERLYWLSAGWSLLVIVVTVVVLAAASHKCDKPLATWLLVNAGYYAVRVAVYGGYVYGKRREEAEQTVSWLPALAFAMVGLLLFEISWYVVGSVWVYCCDECAMAVWGLSLAVVASWYAHLVLPIVAWVLTSCSIAVLVLLLRNVSLDSATPASSVLSTQEQLLTLKESTLQSADCECPICLGRLEQGCKVIAMPCSDTHIFHPKCVRDWLVIDAKCPICRAQL